MRRWLGAVSGLMVAAVLVAVAGRAGAPVATVDVFTVGPAPAVNLAAPEVREAVKAAVARLGEERAAALVGSPAGSAIAADPSESRILRAVEVRQVAEDRIRIRVASRDVEAAHVVADAVRAGFVEAGLKERLRLATETTGGRATIVAAILASIAVLWGAAAGLHTLVTARTARSGDPSLSGALRSS